MKITYYLEVVSSWCHWAEPAWAELKQRYGRRVEFAWKLALMDRAAYPVSKEQCAWFYRRSGSIVRSPYMLNTDWFETECVPYLAPNYVAQAARELGASDDRVRLALSSAACREGQKVGRWEVAVQIAAPAGSLDAAKLLKIAQAPDTAAKVAATTA